MLSDPNGAIFIKSSNLHPDPTTHPVQAPTLWWPTPAGRKVPPPADQPTTDGTSPCPSRAPEHTARPAGCAGRVTGTTPLDGTGTRYGPELHIFHFWWT